MPRVASLVLALLVLVAGCRVREYVVAKDEAPLYSTPTLEEVVGNLPLGHHEPVLDEPEGNVIRLKFNGRSGFARKSDLEIVDYVDPRLDEGADRDDSIGRAVREVCLKHAGGSWAPEVRDAVRDGRVLEGMTREQVELAWGWPRTIEALASPVGGERWVYRTRGYETFDNSGVGSSRKFRATEHPHGSWGGDPWAAPPYRIPVIEERIVEFADRKVTRSYVRRYYDSGGVEDDD